MIMRLKPYQLHDVHIAKGRASLTQLTTRSLVFNSLPRQNEVQPNVSPSVGITQ